MVTEIASYDTHLALAMVRLCTRDQLQTVGRIE